MTHHIKCQPPWFADVAAGRKRFEIRRNDRGFAVGDVLVLAEWVNDRATGREVTAEVTYVLDPTAHGPAMRLGMIAGFVVLGIDLTGESL